MLHLPVDTLKAFMVEVFARLGVPEADARMCSEVLIASDLRGIESQARFPRDIGWPALASWATRATVGAAVSPVMRALRANATRIG